VIGLNRVTSQVIKETLREVFTRQGLPKEIKSDNGKQFIAEDIEEWFDEMGIDHDRVALYAPHQNGLVERFNRNLADKIKECRMWGIEIKYGISEYLFNYRSTPHATTGISPFEAMYNRKMRSELTRFRPEGREGEEGPVDRSRVERSQMKMKEHFDNTRAVKENRIEVGDTVWIKNIHGRYVGPTTVIERTGTSVRTADSRWWPFRRVFPERKTPLRRGM
jgi:hypothetical protein